jgi:hypothetical protein
MGHRSSSTFLSLICKQPPSRFGGTIQRGILGGRRSSTDFAKSVAPSPRMIQLVRVIDAIGADT